MAKIEPIVGHYVHLSYEGEEYRIYFEENGKGIPLICLHTAGADGREYRHQLCDPDIAKDFRVIAFDLPRHGKSNPPKNYYREEREYKLTGKFYTGITMSLCQALDLEKPVIMGSSMGGSICLHFALSYDKEVRALIAIAASEKGTGFWLKPYLHPHIHGGEAIATWGYGLMSPLSPEEYRREVWWYSAQGGPGVHKGDINFVRLEHDFRELCSKISGKVPIYFMTGQYDAASTPEMTERTAKKVKNSECLIMEGLGHVPMSENPIAFKQYLMPILKKIKSL